jgi:hypothetical protein
MRCCRPVLPACLLLFCGLAGCTSQLKLAVASSFIQDTASAAARSDNPDLVARAAPTYLLLLEGLLVRHPDNQQLLISAAQAYTAYGVLVEDQDPEQARSLYQRAKTCALKALARNESIARSLDAPYPQFARLVQHLKRRDLPLVFWAASSWGAWISASTDSLGALAQLPKVILLMEWVVQQDEAFQFGAPHLFLGVYHAALPPALGGNPEQARRHFERALAIGQDRVLTAYVLMARYYARQVFDRELYVSLLNKALALPVDRTSELTVQNVAARRQARKLLEETDDFF